MIIITTNDKPSLSRMGILARDIMDIREKLRDDHISDAVKGDLQKVLASKELEYSRHRKIVFEK